MALCLKKMLLRQFGKKGKFFFGSSLVEDYDDFWFGKTAGFAEENPIINMYRQSRGAIKIRLYVSRGEGGEHAQEILRAEFVDYEVLQTVLKRWCDAFGIGFVASTHPMKVRKL